MSANARSRSPRSGSAQAGVKEKPQCCSRSFDTKGTQERRGGLFVLGRVIPTRVTSARLFFPTTLALVCEQVVYADPLAAQTHIKRSVQALPKWHTGSFPGHFKCRICVVPVCMCVLVCVWGGEGDRACRVASVQDAEQWAGPI